MYSWWYSRYLLLSSLRGHKYDTSVALGDRQPLSHVALPPGPDSYTEREEYLSRNKVFSRSRYHDTYSWCWLLIIYLWVFGTVCTSICWCTSHSILSLVTRTDSIICQARTIFFMLRLLMFAFQPIFKRNLLLLCSFCLGHWYFGCTLHRTIFFCQKLICTKSKTKTFVTSRIASNSR